MTESARRALVGWIVLPVLAASAATLALRLTVRDRVAVLDDVFYVARPILLFVPTALAAAAAWRLRRRRVAWVGAALAAAWGFVFATQSFAWNEKSPPGALRGVFWNVERGRAGWEAVVATLQDLAPDVAWLAETGETADGADDALHAAFPAMRLLHVHGGMRILARGDVDLVRDEKSRKRYRATVARHAIDGRAFTSVFPDVGPRAYPRRAPLDWILEIATSRTSGPLLVVGDMNTPRDSAAFDAWRPHLRHAFETAGRGYDATWPSRLPLLSIDHVWAGGGLEIRTCEIPSTSRSDHLPVVFTFE